MAMATSTAVVMAPRMVKRRGRGSERRGAGRVGNECGARLLGALGIDRRILPFWRAGSERRYREQQDGQEAG